VSALEGWKNKLYFGDNLGILREYVPDESVDLIYLDPPFNSRATYNVLFGEKNGSQSQAQITAFDDTWRWGEEAEATYHELVTEGPKKLSDLVQTLRSFLGINDVMAYLVMMAVRLSELRRVLKPTGSIYLHCDPTASHYLKILMDAAFGPQHFRNEIIWKRTSSHNRPRRWGPVHDVILFYTASQQFTWNRIFQDYSESYVKERYSTVDSRGQYFADNLTGPGMRSGPSGQSWRGIDPGTKQRHWELPPDRSLPDWFIFPDGYAQMNVQERLDVLHEQGLIHHSVRPGGLPRYKRYLQSQKGMPIQDIILDTFPINAMAQERLGYPTQKPEALLERILQASSNEGDLILDPFCGCGTTVNVAERLHRRWVGIDITHLAIALIRNRLQTTFENELSPYKVLGDPKDLGSAYALAEYDRYQFQWWAVGLIGARPAQDKKKGADMGIDGYINFLDDNSGRAKQIIVQVKSGKVSVSQVRDLKGVMDREKATIGVFISLESFTEPMRKEALSAGYYDPEYLSPEHKAPRIQLFTIQELLDGAEPKYPHQLVTTFRRAKRQYKDSGPEQGTLL